MSRFKLPHYSRLFSAAIFPAILWISFWCGLVTLLAVNIYWRRYINPPQPDKIKVLTHPQDASYHFNLAKLFYLNGYPVLAKREMYLTGTDGILTAKNPDTAGSGVLGLFTSSESMLSEWESESKNLLASYLFWKTVAADKPDYVSARIMAAAYAYLINRKEEAQLILSRAQISDPTNPQISRLKQDIN